MYNLMDSAGVDVDASIARFGGNEALWLKYLRRLSADDSFAAMLAAIQHNDRSALREACHTLKGISGTLGLADLYEATSAMTAAFRAETQADISAHYQAISAAYDQALALIAQLGEE